MEQIQPTSFDIRFQDIAPGIEFEANGTTYQVSETFAIGRFEKVEELEEELLTFSDKQTGHQVMLNAMQLINEYRAGDAYVLMYNKIESDQRNVKLMHYVLRLCTAYINEKGEDLRYLSEDTMAKKILDWSEAGLDVRPFLHFACAVCDKLLQSFKNPIVHILTEAKKISEALSEQLDIKTLTQEQASGPVPPASAYSVTSSTSAGSSGSAAL